MLDEFYYITLNENAEAEQIYNAAKEPAGSPEALPPILVKATAPASETARAKPGSMPVYENSAMETWLESINTPMTPVKLERELKLRETLSAVKRKHAAAHAGVAEQDDASLPDLFSGEEESQGAAGVPSDDSGGPRVAPSAAPAGIFIARTPGASRGPSAGAPAEGAKARLPYGGKKTRKNRKIKIRKFSKDKNKKNKKNKKQTKNKKHKKGKTRNLKKKPKKTRRRRTY